MHDRATLSSLKTRLEAATGQRVAIFHEDLAPDRRDLEVAEFRRPRPDLLFHGVRRRGPQLRVLPASGALRPAPDPADVEQRIGRLDRVTRRRPIEILYFRPPAGFEAELARLYEAIGVLREPLGAWSGTLGRIAEAIREGEAEFARSGRPLPCEELAREIHEEVAARERAVFHHLHQDGYEKALGEAILRRVPPDLDGLHERFVTDACALLGFETAEKPGPRTHYFELGGQAIVDSLPGVPGGTRYLGTFDREEAVVREELEYFASGHPLIEGLLAELEDASRGRTALLELAGAGEAGLAFLLLLGSEGTVRAEACDHEGRPRPDWMPLLLARRRELRGLSRDEAERRLPGRLDWRALRSSPRPAASARPSGPWPRCGSCPEHRPASAPPGEVQPVHHDPAVADHEQRVLERRASCSGLPSTTTRSPRSRPRPRRSRSRGAAARPR